MSIVSNGPDAQDALFETQKPQDLPASLTRSSYRLDFPPSYVIVGIYRLLTDKSLYVPAWEKCKHGTRRGAMVGLVWAMLTFHIQRKFIKVFLANSPRVTGLSNDTIFGYQVPFNLSTYAAVLLLGDQITYILHFFLSRNIRIARQRAWAQTLTSRGKGPEFWWPYVEEWEHPPGAKEVQETSVEKVLGSRVGRFVVRRVLLLPFSLYPLIGIIISASLRALGTSRYLHTPYFESKKMSPHQQLIFIQERKRDYQLFGFTAALLEGLPIIGLIFTISNRIGAAMWAHDLEKRQHFISSRQKTMMIEKL